VSFCMNYGCGHMSLLPICIKLVSIYANMDNVVCMDYVLFCIYVQFHLVYVYLCGLHNYT